MLKLGLLKSHSYVKHRKKKIGFTLLRISGSPYGQISTNFKQVCTFFGRISTIFACNKINRGCCVIKWLWARQSYCTPVMNRKEKASFAIYGDFCHCFGFPIFFSVFQKGA